MFHNCFDAQLHSARDFFIVASPEFLVLQAKTDGTTVIRGAVADQAALYGLLQRVRDLGLPLVSVTRDETDELTRLGRGPATAAAAVEPGLSASTARTSGRVR